MKRFLWIPLIFILLAIYFFNIYNFLSISHPVKADVLVVEGWIPPNLLEEAIEEFNQNDYQFIATTGVPLSPEFRMPFSGYLIFNFEETPIICEGGQCHIDVNASGTPVENQFANLIVLVNDSIQFKTSTTEIFTNYNFTAHADTINKISLWFDNDAANKEEDRDLIVLDISINGKKYSPRQINVTYDRGDLGGDDIYSANFTSVADEAALILQKKGIPPEKIIAIPTDEMEINRTYNSALAFGEWLKNNNKESIKGINVISLGTHSRRSWILFKQNIKEDIPVGIISLKSPFTPDEDWWKSTYETKSVLIESVKYLYTKIFL